MRIPVARVAAAIALVCSSASASASSYTVSASLLHNGKSFANPTAMVENDTPASVEVSGADGYKLSLVVTDLASDQIRVAATVESSRGTFSPIVVVRPGKTATVTVGEIGLALRVDRSEGEASTD